MRRAVIALVMAVGVLAGCSGVPDSGDPVVVPNRKLEQFDVNVDAELVGPRSGDGPLDVMELLLNAARTTQSRDRIGEKFLTPRAEDAWKRLPADARLFNPGTLKIVSETATNAVVEVPGTVTGIVSEFGIHRALNQKETYKVSMVNRGGWRIDSGLPGVLVRDKEFSDAFRKVPLYFAGFNTEGADVLVPELRFMDASIAGVTLLTPVVRALLRGPSPWLSPVTRNPLPANTTLRSNVTLQDVNNDIVVDLSSDVESARPEDLKAFAAQVAWSLRGYFERDVRLQVNGESLAVPGVDAIQGPEHWERYNAAVGPSQPLYYVRGGALVRFGERENSAEELPGGDMAKSGVISAAISTDDTGVALVRQETGNRQTLWIGTGQNVVRAVTGRSISRPTWGYGHDAVLAVVDGQLYRIDQNPAARKVTVRAPAPIGPIRSIRLSPEGARLALVAGNGAQAKVYVGLLQPQTGDGGGPVLRDLRQVTVPIASVQDVGWSEDTPVTVAVAGQGAGGLALVRKANIDGGEAPETNWSGLKAAPVLLATSHRVGTIPFVESGGGLYQGGLRTWTLQSDIADARSPFYPG